MIDQPSSLRPGEAFSTEKLTAYLKDFFSFSEAIAVRQFPSGFSNLTYLIQAGPEEFILRRPPLGANIKSAHDMAREYRVLVALKNAGYKNAPEPVLLCEDETVIGATFYLMRRVAGVILRNRVPAGLTISPATFQNISRAAIDQLAALHQLDLEVSGLGQMGKAEGYVARQVEGWIKRYENSETDTIDTLNEVAAWMKNHVPPAVDAAFIHNDFKYDNLVLDSNDLTRIVAVLDWEMATVGDRWMDLGTTLAYWAEAGDADALKPFGLTWMAGNMTRAEVLNYYQEKAGRGIGNFTFYYAFGCYKVATICQQIYHRYKKGITQDPRFGALIHLIRACGENAKRAIDDNHL